MRNCFPDLVQAFPRFIRSMPMILFVTLIKHIRAMAMWKCILWLFTWCYWSFQAGVANDGFIYCKWVWRSKWMNCYGEFQKLLRFNLYGPNWEFSVRDAFNLGRTPITAVWTWKPCRVGAGGYTWVSNFDQQKALMLLMNQCDGKNYE